MTIWPDHPHVKRIPETLLHIGWQQLCFLTVFLFFSFFFNVMIDTIKKSKALSYGTTINNVHYQKSDTLVQYIVVVIVVSVKIEVLFHVWQCACDGWRPYEDSIGLASSCPLTHSILITSSSSRPPAPAPGLISLKNADLPVFGFGQQAEIWPWAIQTDTARFKDISKMLCLHLPVSSTSKFKWLFKTKKYYSVYCNLKLLTTVMTEGTISPSDC